MMHRLRRLLLVNITAPAAALLFAFAVSSIALLLSDNNPVEAFQSMWSYGTRLDSVISMINRAVPLYVSGLAVAIGFKMGLFNIGVEGQYRIATILAAAAGAAVTLPAPLHILLILVVAMAAGAAWAYIPGILKVTRGVHEVISTIMMNAIATGLAAYLLAEHLREQNVAGDLVPKTPEIPASGQLPSLNSWLEAIGLEVPRGSNLQSFVLIAIVIGVIYHVLITRTRFGFDLRASGINPMAAHASGVDDKAMVVRSMVLGGAVAGLVGMGPLLGFFHRYTTDFPVQLGFTGIGIALLGRNHPVGIGVGALLFGFLDRAAQILDLEGIPREVVVIIQGVTVLSVVVAYEIVTRIVTAREIKAAAEAAERHAPAEVTA